MSPISRWRANSPKFFTFAAIMTLCLRCGSTQTAANQTIMELLFSDYDKDVRPNHGVGPMVLEVDLYVESFANIAEANMEYTLFGYFRQEWTDKRLAGKSQETIQLKGSAIEHAWTPDTYISNCRQSNLRQKDSEAETSFFISPNGSIFYSRGVKIVAFCDMNLKDFPMDTQKCFLSFGSYGHNTNSVIYKWRRGTIEVEKTSIAQFDLKATHLLTSTLPYVSGNYTYLIIAFQFERRIGYYINQVYIPDTLIVIISWMVFWLDQEDMGGRVGLGITTLLTIMFLLGSANMSLPRVSYAKAIDWYLIVSFVFVFLVLVECIIVYILGPGKRSRKESTGKRMSDLEEGTAEKSHSTGARCIEKLLKKRRLLDLNMEMIANNNGPVVVTDRNSGVPFLTEKKIDSEVIDKPREQDSMKAKKTRRCASAGVIVDRISRFLFPLAFMLFNVFYWRHYLHI